MSEQTELQEPLELYLKKRNIRYIHIKNSGRSKHRHTTNKDLKGLPDLVIFLKGNTVFIELKTPEKFKFKDYNLSEDQKEWIDYLKDKCYDTLVTCSLQDAIRFIEERI